MIPSWKKKKKEVWQELEEGLTAVRHKDLKDGEGWKEVLAHPPLASPAFPSDLMEGELACGTQRSKVKILLDFYQKDCSYGCFM